MLEFSRGRCYRLCNIFDLHGLVTAAQTLIDGDDVYKWQDDGHFGRSKVSEKVCHDLLNITAVCMSEIRLHLVFLRDIPHSTSVYKCSAGERHVVLLEDCFYVTSFTQDTDPYQQWDHDHTSSSLIRRASPRAEFVLFDLASLPEGCG